MTPTRRDVLGLGAAALLLPSAGARASNGFEDEIARFTGGARPKDGGVRLDVPEIADNGGAVPVRVAADGARRIAVFTEANPYPGVAVFAFGPLAPPEATIRIRLARSQRVIAIAEMEDGTFRRAARRVAVTVGGCG